MIFISAVCAGLGSSLASPSENSVPLQPDTVKRAKKTAGNFGKTKPLLEGENRLFCTRSRQRDSLLLAFLATNISADSREERQRHSAPKTPDNHQNTQKPREAPQCTALYTHVPHRKAPNAVQHASWPGYDRSFSSPYIREAGPRLGLELPH